MACPERTLPFTLFLLHRVICYKVRQIQSKTQLWLKVIDRTLRIIEHIYIYIYIPTSALNINNSL